jgi:hypothetical protein
VSATIACGIRPCVLSQFEYQALAVTIWCTACYELVVLLTTQRSSNSHTQKMHYCLQRPGGAAAVPQLQTSWMKSICFHLLTAASSSQGSLLYPAAHKWSTKAKQIIIHCVGFLVSCQTSFVGHA